MRSQLTRRFIRQFTYNESCSEVRPAVQCCRRSRTSQCTVNTLTAQRRSLFGFSRNARKEANLTGPNPGYDVLLKLKSQLEIGARPPPSEDIIQAFNAFTRVRREQRSKPVQMFEAEEAMRAFLYLQKTNRDVEGFGLSNEDLRMALSALANLSKPEHRIIHRQFAALVYNELERRRISGIEPRWEVTPSAPTGSVLAMNLFPYLKILSLSGDPEQARALLMQYYESDLSAAGHVPWDRLVSGFLMAEQEDEVLKTIDMMKSFGLPLNSSTQKIIVRHYAEKGDLKSTKRWYSIPLEEGTSSWYADRAVLNLCIRERDYEWGESVFRNVLQTPAPSAGRGNPDWKTILRWSAARGKGVDEIERLMNIMVQRNEGLPKAQQSTPNIDMINGLIELAISRNDPYTAERYVALGQRWNIELNAQTYLMQLNYRLQVGDLDGAKAAYQKLRTEDTSDNQDIPLINKLIVALCEKGEPDGATMSIVEDLSERKVGFEAVTVAALSQLHLRRGELDQVTNLLSIHTHQCSLSERETIRDVFVNFILDRRNSNPQAWNAYTTFSPAFPETPVSTRTQIMREFFARDRSDMGTHVFGHMRQQQHPSFRPTAKTYRECFQGIARAGGDIESLYLVHNMLKVDTQIEPDTRLTNGLMLAYTACGDAGRALEYWDDIAHSREGPTYSSIQIALRACERAPFGERRAKDIWARLRRFEIQMTREIYASYIGALAGQGVFQECVELIEKAEVDAELKPDALMVGTFYNAAPGIHNKDQVEAWARKAYPAIWNELLALGKTTVSQGDALEDAGLEGEMDDEDLIFNRVQLFNIDRSVEA